MDCKTLYAEEVNGEYISRGKFEIVQNEMLVFLEGLSKKMQDQTAAKNPGSWAYKVKTKLNAVLRRFKTMPTSEAMRAECDDLFAVYTEFLDLVAWLNETVDFIPTKQEFCAYAQMSVSCYNELLSSGTDEQRQMLCDIDSYLSDMQLSGAQAGSSKERSTEFRLTSKDFGHSIVRKPNTEEALDVLAKEKLSSSYWMAQIEGLQRPQVAGKKPKGNEE